MTSRSISTALALIFTLTLCGAVFAQGVQTGTLRGTVELDDGSTVPGVLVTATSPAIQGQRTTVTGESGEWLIRNLSPGPYTVTFELEGMATVQSAASVTLGQVTPVNVAMRIAAEEETIIVTGELPSVLASSEVSTTYSFEEVNDLPINRTPAAIAALAPGLTTNTPNGGQLTISGGFAYDNVFLIDGVDANDNLFGSTSPVFIEDAIADLQVLTSGISAEYGRFSGGVVNVITKSGGNEFTGTLRADLTDDDWRTRTPIEDEGVAEGGEDPTTGPTNKEYSATLGGYVMKDTLWFFLAGRDEETSETDTFFLSGLPEPTSASEERQEYKATFNIADKHQLQGQFTDREQTGSNASFSFSGTPSTLRTRIDPSDLKVGRYSGVLTSSLFAELQISEKTFTFMNQHGLDASTVPGTQSFIENSPFVDFFGSTDSAHYNAPYFDGKDPEDRNNEQVAASLSYFFDSPAAGSHDVKVGFEDFTSMRTGGNSQTPTDFVMAAEPVLDANGDPVLDANNEWTPNWVPGASGAWLFLPNRNAEVELQTESFYVNDRWQLNDHWSFNVGFRYEDVSGQSDRGIVTVDTDAFVPRLGASYDLRGDGKYRFDATYAEYAGKYSESQFAQNTDVGNPPALLYLYIGAPGQGLDFAPAYDFDNRNNYAIVLACDGTQNVFADDNLTSPTVEEVTLAAGMELERGGYVKLIFTDRQYTDFVEDFSTTETGVTEVIVNGVSAGTFTNNVISNTNDLEREYQALQLIGRYRLTDNWSVDGSWTHQLSNDGNFEGEGTNTPGSSSAFGDYPEIRSAGQHFPIGPLDSFTEHKVRAWTNYNLALGERVGDLNFGLLLRFDSGRTRSLSDTTRTFSAIQNQILADLYPDGPSRQTLFFGQRGGVEFDDALTFDLAVNYQLPIWRDLDLWIKADVINLFDDDSQIDGRTEVAADFNGPVDALGLPTGFTRPDNLFSARDNDDFVDPREYRFTVGFRF